jgi:drug/metabolite transporter (DMT)-like permease
MFKSILSGVFASSSALFSKLALQQSYYLFGLMLISNYFMFYFYTLGLQESSTIQVITLNSASNMIMTGLYGFFLFDEKITTKWILGATLICIGSIILTKNEDDSKKYR